VHSSAAGEIENADQVHGRCLKTSLVFSLWSLVGVA
jgi:hypothetical protein